MIRSFLLQLQFFTRIPVPVNIPFDEKRFARSIFLAPLVGLIIGAGLAGLYYLTGIMAGSPIIGVIFAVILEIILTGGLHMDGLADTCDGIFSNTGKETILKIMRDPRIGTNGVLALIIVIILKISMLALMDRSIVIGALIAVPVLSRLNIVICAGISNYARKGKGMAGAVVRHTGWKGIVIAFILSSAIAVPILRYYALIAIPGAILFVFLFTLYVKRKIGGITGDIIGAVVELSETVIFVILVLTASLY